MEASEKFLGLIDKKKSRFRTTKPTVKKVVLHVSFVELKSSKIGSYVNRLSNVVTELTEEKFSVFEPSVSDLKYGKQTSFIRRSPKYWFC
ncbi:hypothetical protein TNCV_3838741 [Trichonephila clavipes]|nr:hypothetical protein TNCV_3838741 [Trichonephila clavipes]